MLARRTFLLGGAAAALGAAASRAVGAEPTSRTAARPLADPTGQRLVVLGAGFGGLTAALTVKRLRPEAEVVVVESAPYFVSAPGSLGYLFGLVRFDAISRSYANLRRTGLRLVPASVRAVDPARKLVVTSVGAVGYDYLLVATGLRLDAEEVPGLAERPEINLAFFDTGPSLVDARRRIADFPGGRVVIATPVSAYKCPPAPYEYALLWADFLRRRRLPGRVTLIDPRPKPTPPALAPGLLTAMDAQHDRLRYEPFTRLLAVDGEARTVETDAGTLPFDLLSVVPTNTPLTLLADSGLGDPFIDVDPATFRSIEDPAVYAVGDTADTPYAKTAAAAITSARIAGRHRPGPRRGSRRGRPPGQHLFPPRRIRSRAPAANRLVVPARGQRRARGQDRQLERQPAQRRPLAGPAPVGGRRAQRALRPVDLQFESKDRSAIGPGRAEDDPGAGSRRANTLKGVASWLSWRRSAWLRAS